MRKNYRIVVWGTGSVGKVCLREVLDRPELELVGVYGYNKSKIGKDAAEMVGRPSCGILITQSIDDVIALKPDCVLWTAGFPIGKIAQRMEDTVARILESGANVVTCAGHHYPPAHGADYTMPLKAACSKGKSSLHGTGENPGFFMERAAVTLCGCTNRVERLVLNEYADVAKPGDKTDPSVMGFGLAPEQLTREGPVAEVWRKYYFVETLNLTSLALFSRPLDSFEVTQDLVLADKDLEFSTDNGEPIDFVVKKGTVIAQTYRFQGYVDGDNRLTATTNWYLTEKHNPFHGKADCQWDIEIEGDPVSLSCNINAFASLKDRRLLHPGDPTTPAWFITGITMVQAIPRVVAAAPGFVYASVFAHATPDFRSMENRNSIAEPGVA